MVCGSKKKKSEKAQKEQEELERQQKVEREQEETRVRLKEQKEMERQALLQLEREEQRRVEEVAKEKLLREQEEMERQLREQEEEERRLREQERRSRELEEERRREQEEVERLLREQEEEERLREQRDVENMGVASRDTMGEDVFTITQPDEREKFRFQEDDSPKRPLLAQWEEEPEDDRKKKRDNKKFLPCLLCLLCLLLLLLLLCGWLAWGLGGRAGTEAVRSAAAEANENAAGSSARYGNAHKYAGSHYAQNGGAGGGGNAAGRYGGAGGKAAGSYGGVGGNAAGNYEGAGENAAGNYEGAGGNAASNYGGAGGNAAENGSPGSVAVATASAPTFAAGPFTLVAHGSIIEAQGSGPADGIYHELKNSYGMTAWKREDGKCEVRRLVVDRWDLICDGHIWCSKPLTDHLEPPVKGFECKYGNAPVFHSESGNAHVSGSPKEWRVPGNYLKQSELKNGKPWYKSDRNCIIYWAQASTSWELWCFSDRWCKTVIPLYTLTDDTDVPPEGQWRTQTGRAHGVGPPPVITYAGKTPEKSIKNEIKVLGDLDAQKKMAADEKRSLEAETYTLQTMHI